MVFRIYLNIKILLNYQIIIYPLGLDVLHISAQGDQPSAIYYWKEKGLNLNSIDNKGSTPLHWAAFKGFEQSVNFLSVWSKKLDIQDENGKCTPLHLAVISGNTKVVRRLLIKGADRTIKDLHNKTAADIAKELDYNNIYEMIQNQGAVCKQCDSNPKLEKLTRSSISLIYFLILYFFSQIGTFFVIWPYVTDGIQIYVYCGVWAASFIFFSISYLKDPGYLKRYRRSQKDKENFLQILQTVDCLQVCPECQILKPKRARHCEICQSCVQVFDHHCPWINNCVGAQNHSYYLLFLISLWTNILYIFIFVGLNIKHRERNFSYFPSELLPESNDVYFFIKIIISSIVLFVSFIFFLPLTNLVWVHLTNFALNKTTSERFGFKARNLQSESLSESSDYTSQMSQISSNLLQQTQVDQEEQQASGNPSLLQQQNHKHKSTVNQSTKISKIQNQTTLSNINISQQLQKTFVEQSSMHSQRSQKSLNKSTDIKQLNCGSFFNNCCNMCCRNKEDETLIRGSLMLNASYV